MLFLASAQADARVKTKIEVHYYQQRRCSQKEVLCKLFGESLEIKRMRQRSFSKASNEFSRVKSERQVRSIESNEINSFARTNITLGSSFRDSSISNGESTSLENISQATLASSDIETSVQKDPSDKIYLHVNGSLKLVFILLTILGILIPIASIIYCFWTTRRSATTLEQIQRRLADNENNLLNQSLPDLEALMLSVQNIGCYRLGMPETMGAPLSSQRDDSRSIRRSTFPKQHDLRISANRQTQNLLDESKTDTKSGIKSEDKRRNIYTSCSSNSNCPPHIYRSDGEFVRDQYYNSSSQHNAEIKRCYIQAPPNKTVQDVPDTQAFNLPVPTSHLNNQQLTQSKVDNKVKTMVKGFFMKINGSSTQKVESSKINSNIMPRSQSTDTSNELVLNGSTNFNLHSKSYVNNNEPGAARLLKNEDYGRSSSASSPEQSL